MGTLQDPPRILARPPGAPEGHRQTPTELVFRRDAEYAGESLGRAEVSVHRSTGRDERGGVVIDLRVQDPDFSLVPHAETLPDGVRIHLAGQHEALMLLRLLKLAVVQVDEELRREDEALWREIAGLGGGGDQKFQVTPRLVHRMSESRFAPFMRLVRSSS